MKSIFAELLALVLVSAGRAAPVIRKLSFENDLNADAIVLFATPKGECYDKPCNPLSNEYKYKGLVFSGGAVIPQNTIYNEQSPRALFYGSTRMEFEPKAPQTAILTFSQPITKVGFAAFPAPSGEYLSCNFALQPGGFTTGESVRPLSYYLTSLLSSVAGYSQFVGVASTVGFTTLRISLVGTEIAALNMRSLKWQFAKAPVPKSEPGPYNGFAVTVPGTVPATKFDYGGPYVAYSPKATKNPKLRVGEQVEGADGSVGYIQDGDYVRYTVKTAKAGSYMVKYLLAGKPGTPLPVDIYMTLNDGCAGDQEAPYRSAAFTASSWKPGKPYAATARISLPPGLNTLTVCFAKGRNLNFFGFQLSTGAGSFGGPYKGIATAIPGTLKASNFDTGGPYIAYSPKTTKNPKLRPGEQVEGANGAVINPSAGDWIRYTVDIKTAATYDVTYLLGSNTAKGISLQVYIAFDSSSCSGPGFGGYGDGAFKTGSWGPTPVTGSIQKVALPAGRHTMTVCFRQVTGPLNFYGVQLPITTFTSRANKGGVYKAPHPVPGTVPAAEYDSGFYDGVASNAKITTDPRLRPSDTVTGADGSIGYIRPNDWVRYTVKSAKAGTYTVKYLLAAKPPSPTAVSIYLTTVPGCTGTQLAPYKNAAFTTNTEYSASNTKPAKPFTATATLKLPAGETILTVCFAQGSYVNYFGMELTAAPAARSLRGSSAVASIDEELI